MKFIFTAVAEIISRTQSEQLILKKDALLTFSYSQWTSISLDLSFSRSTEGPRCFPALVNILLIFVYLSCSLVKWFHYLILSMCSLKVTRNTGFLSV